MNAIEFFGRLSNAEPGTMMLSPGPLEMKIGTADINAARSIIAWHNKIEGLTMGQLLDTLDAMRWWLVFWAGLAEGDVQVID